MTDEIVKTDEPAPAKTTRATKAKAEVLPKDIGSIIPLIRQELGAVAKDQKATGGGANFAYRGHDQIINAIVPLFDKYGVWTTAEDTSVYYGGRNAGTKYATASVISETVTFHAPDGSTASTTIVAESVDYGNKATGQAGTYAYRIAIEKTFTIPTSQPDPDAVNEEFDATTEAPKPEQPAAAPDQEQIDALRAKIKASYEAINIPASEIPLRGKLFFNGREGWGGNVGALTKLLAAIEAGEDKAIGDLPTE